MATVGARRPTRKGCPNRSVAFKREIAAAACAPGLSVAKLALARGVNTNLLFKWRRQYRAGKFGAPDPEHVLVSRGADAAPVANEPDAAMRLLPVQVAAVEPDCAVPSSPCIEVVFRSATVRICGMPDTAALRVVLDTLARRS
jgi:transposase